MNIFSDGEGMKCSESYDIEPNTTNLLQQVGLKYESNEKGESQWFISYSDPAEDEWESISEEEYNSNLGRVENIDRIDFTPLSKN